MKNSEKMNFEAKFVKSKDFYKEFKKFNSVFLKLLFNKINKNNIQIADYGGGSGILTKDIISFCSKRKINARIENIDINPKIMRNSKNVFFIRKNALKYRRKNVYDFAVCRYMLHFFDDKDNKKLLNNIYYNLKSGGYFLFINWVIDDSKTNKLKRSIFGLIESKKGVIRRTIPTSNYMKNLSKKSGFRISNCEKHDYRLHINDFYKNRFNLTKSQISQIEDKLRIKSHKQSQFGLLLRK